MALGQTWIMDSNGNHGSNLPIAGNENSIFDIAKIALESGDGVIRGDLISDERERSCSIWIEQFSVVSLSYPEEPPATNPNQSFSLPSQQQIPLFQNISAPGIVDLLEGDDGHQKYFDASKKEEALNAELVRCQMRIKQLEKKLNSLFLENERLKNELDMLRLSCSSDGHSQEQKGQTRYWSAHEHKRFLEALQLFGEGNKKAISVYVGSRSIAQIRSHLQKYRLRMKREDAPPHESTVIAEESTPIQSNSSDRHLEQMPTNERSIQQVAPITSPTCHYSAVTNNNIYDANPFLAVCTLQIDISNSRSTGVVSHYSVWHSQLDLGEHKRLCYHHMD